MSESVNFRAANDGCPIFLIIVTSCADLPRSRDLRETYGTINGAISPHLSFGILTIVHPYSARLTA